MLQHLIVATTLQVLGGLKAELFANTFFVTSVATTLQVLGGLKEDVTFDENKLTGGNNPPGTGWVESCFTAECIGNPGVATTLQVLGGLKGRTSKHPGRSSAWQQPSRYWVG
ncbi:hypothetical protein Npun_R5654 [Nostoc punctiforme PCC 73102]|uniref:Uncharacterized protein n=1 Tax=Nostoc punctiforme (strain ATCC 29133 / PCC 73102) TaxID=63737 RepID=B2J7Z1_NOSP7|nr:hypothetical protein Npun_R5654 [Nostoc punctiforme PCC 73102]